jgi:hypothetical protein
MQGKLADGLNEMMCANKVTSAPTCQKEEGKYSSI